jgi:hypothetical protein
MWFIEWLLRHDVRHRLRGKHVPGKSSVCESGLFFYLYLRWLSWKEKVSRAVEK